MTWQAREPEVPSSTDDLDIAVHRSLDGTAAINSGPYDGLPTADFKQRSPPIWPPRARPRGGELQAPRLALQPAAFLGRAVSDPPRTGRSRPAQRADPRLKPQDLPLDLPETMQFDAAHDRPEPPLDKAPDSWLYVTLDGKRYRRETNTMPQWAGSCWYYLRFLDPKNDQA